MTLRSNLPAGPPTAFAFSTVMGVKGDPGAKGDPGGPGGGFVVGGDLAGASGFQTVQKIQNVAVLAGTPADGQVLTYVAANSRYEPRTPSPPVVGGDLGGTLPNPSVVGLRGSALPILSTGVLNWTGSAWAFSPLPAPRRQTVNHILDFGAVGDDTTDDTAAFAALFAACVSNGLPGYLDPPPVAYKITAPLDPPAGIRLFGDALALGQCVIRAHAAMPYMLAMHTTNSSTSLEDTNPCDFGGFTLDGNGGLAKHGALRNSDYISSWGPLFLENCSVDGMHARGHRLPALIGSVTLGGGAPAGLTLTQPDPGYTAISNSCTLVLKAISPTSYVVSVDNGATYSTVQFNIISGGPSNVMSSSSSSVTNYTGYQAHFPSATFANGNTWSIPITIQPEDQVSTVVNVETVITNTWASTCGTVPVDPGTVDIVAGSPIIRSTSGGGNAWLTGAYPQMRPGDSITIIGAGVAGPGSTQGTFPVLAAGDDGTIYLYPLESPQATLTGCTYHRAIGYGIYEDESGDTVRNRYYGGVIDVCANGMRVSGDSSGAPLVEGIRISGGINGATGIGLLVGGVLNKPQGFVANAIEIKSGWGCRVYVPFGSSSTFIEPRQGFHLNDTRDFLGAGVALIIQGGSLLRYAAPGSGLAVQAASLQPFNSLQLIANTVSVTGANQVLQPPDTNTPLPFNTTYTVLTANADYVDLNSVLLAAPHEVGQVWYIENSENSNFAIGFLDQSIIGTNTNLEGGGQVLCGGERLKLIAQLKGTVFSPVWTQDGPISRNWNGPHAKASQTGGGSHYCKTTSATPVVLGRWSLTFSSTGGFLMTCRVAAIDTGNTDRAFWLDVSCAVDGAANIIGVTQVAGMWGTNGGAVPAGWALTYAVVNVGGDFQLQLKATGATGRTVKFFGLSSSISVFRN